MRSPLGTGSCWGSAWGLWTGRTSEAELEENGIFSRVLAPNSSGKELTCPHITPWLWHLHLPQTHPVTRGGFLVLFNPHDKNGRDESHSSCAQTLLSTFPRVPSPPDLIF